MCGIAGVYRFDRSELAREDVRALARMSDIQRHRGPDDDGLEVFPRCALASRRLSILDLSPHGHMPMLSEDGRYALVQNGEIYNYVELREELRALGHTFRSGGDTEVILNAYRQWGAACLERLVGMWAFALLDIPKQTLLLSRDRFGVKPLYVYRSPSVLVFASEIKAIVSYLRSVGIPVAPHEAAIATYTATGLVDGLEQTFFAGITRFAAAEAAVVTPDGIRAHTYWDLPTSAAEIAGVDEPAGIVRGVEQRLDEAVRVHLRSDVPVGVCLSGGLDSSAVVGLASRHVDRVNTFTVYFDDGPDFDERSYAHAVAGQFGALASERSIPEHGLLDTLQRVIWHLDEPSLAMGVLPQWHVMELARERVKVVLDGQGGDEVFAGYANYFPQHLYGVLGARPTHFPLEVAGIARRHGWRQARSVARSAVAMRVRAPAQPTADASADARLLTPELRSLADVSHDEWRLWPKRFDDHLTNVLYWELTRTRLPALLRYEDRLSMAFSIESRVPFLDHRLVELAFAVPSLHKVHQGWSKYVLRRALEPLLPREVVWRRDKKGFPTPIGRWLRDERGAEALALLRDPERRTRHIFPFHALEREIDDHCQGRADRSWQLWRALSTELWFRAFF
ncbi:MAG: asparagine synthase (glutamine-hydrolyzing) [Chloroflexi bacterium]|nr:asparagine synthase (glutamine-hydrolyzing) [Chloroflexota bacterium]